MAVAAIAALCFAVSFGYTYGIDNQVEHMLSSLRPLGPTISHRDWHAMQTAHYHFPFVVRRGEEAALGDHRVAPGNGAFVALDLHAAR